MSKDLEKASETLEETLTDIQKAAAANFYDIVQISLADKEGKVVGRASMKYEDILAMTKMHTQDSSHVVGMLFHAVESETRNKLREEKENEAK